MTAVNADVEAQRLEQLAELGILDTPSEQSFDDVVRLASHICETPIALVSLVDDARQWFKARVGLNVCETSRDISFCSVAIQSPEPLIVPDAAKDPRFMNSALVTHAPFIRFYAGIPLEVNGHRVGSLCVIDTIPRELSSEKIELLKGLARTTVSQFEARVRNQELTRLNELAEEQVVALNQSQEIATEAVRQAKLAVEHNAYSARRFASLFSGLPVASFTFDPEGSVYEWNTEAERLFNIQSHEAFGQPAAACLPKGKQVMRRLRKVVNGDTVSGVDFSVGSSSDSPRHLMAHAYPLKDLEGQVVAGVAVFIDITERKESEERLRKAVENLPAGALMVEGNRLFINPYIERLTGYAKEELQTLDDWFRLLFPGRSDEGRAFYEADKADGFATPRTVTVRRKDGEDRIVDFAAYRDDHNEVWMVNDVTEKFEAQAALGKSEALFRTATKSLQSGIILFNQNVEITYVNPIGANILGLTVDQVMNRTSKDPRWGAICEDGSPLDPADMPSTRSIVHGEQVRDFVHGIKLGKGGRRWVNVNSAPIIGDDGRPVGAVVCFTDVTEQRNQKNQIESQLRLIQRSSNKLERQRKALVIANERLEQLATVDGLTGVLNHRTFQDRLTRQLETSIRSGEGVSLILLDIDHFKSFNDELGHQAGDETLRLVARTLEVATRPSDIVARYGGEEFAVVLPNTDLEGALQAAERIRKCLADREWPQRVVTASLGIATTFGGATPKAELISEADQAMYAAKRGGRNQAWHYDRISLAA